MCLLICTQPTFLETINDDGGDGGDGDVGDDVGDEDVGDDDDYDSDEDIIFSGEEIDFYLASQKVNICVY